MSLREGDELISMDILPSQVADLVASAVSEELESEEMELEPTSAQGPWVLVITTGGLGKRVPVSQFRLQNRAGMGIRAIKFRKPEDQLAALRIVNESDEMMLVTSRGIIIRQAVKAISCQSRAATGVRVQRLDEDDAIVAVALVPVANGDSNNSDQNIRDQNIGDHSSSDQNMEDQSIGDYSNSNHDSSDEPEEPPTPVES
jgi:DNA gyrase subunit A